MSLTLRPVRAGTGRDEAGLPGFDDAPRLAAVPTRRGDQHGDGSGHWSPAARFAVPDGLDHPTYADLGVAQEGIRQHLARGR